MGQSSLFATPSNTLRASGLTVRLFSHLSLTYSRTALFLIFTGSFGLFLGFPNPLLHFPPAGLVPAACLFLLANQQGTLRDNFLRGWLLGAMGQAASLYWLAWPMCEVGKLPLFLAVPTIMLLGALLGIFAGFTSVCLYWLKKTLTPDLSITNPTACRATRVLLRALFSGLAFGSTEWALSFFLTGFPWVTLAAGFVAWPSFIQVSNIIGAYGFTALVSFAVCLGISLHQLSDKGLFFTAVCVLCILTAIPYYGHYRITSFDASLPKTHPPALSVEFSNGLEHTQPATPQTLQAETTLPVVFGLIQGNIDQNQKWDPTFQRDTLVHYMALSEQLLATAQEQGKTVDMLLWPETAMPFYYQNAEPFASITRHFAAKHAVALGFGTLGYMRDIKREVLLFNRLQTISFEGITGPYYDKQHLVPFGEYIPLEVALPFLQRILQGMSFSPGSMPNPIPLATLHSSKSGPMLGVLICYEAIFPEIAQKQVAAGANVLLNISNDAWFGKTSAPTQHLALTAMRAVEQMRPVVRSTNTGYSAFIDPLGRVQQQGPLFTESILLGEALPEVRITPFHSFYTVFEALFLAGLLIPVFCGFYLYLRRHRTQ